MNLYHYTNIDTLQKILESKKLRFTTLEDVDDSQEMMTGDMGQFGKHAFVSCFTSKCEESIEMWNMHKLDGNGVRLGFKHDIFNEFTNYGRGEEFTYVVFLNQGVFKVKYSIVMKRKSYILIL